MRRGLSSGLFSYANIQIEKGKTLQTWIIHGLEVGEGFLNGINDGLWFVDIEVLAHFLKFGIEAHFG
jgi:hypothetical protein